MSRTTSRQARLAEKHEPQHRLRLVLFAAGLELAALLAAWAPATLLSGDSHPRTVLLVAAPLLASLVLVTVSVGVDGRHTFERWLRRADLRARERKAALVASAAFPGMDPRLRALAELAADLRLGSVVGPPGSDGVPGAEVGFGSDATGWFVVAEITPPPGLRGEAREPIDLGRLACALVAHPTPPSAVQVVVHTVPPEVSPTTRGSRGRTAATNGTPSVALIHESYQQLRDGRPIAARQYAWLAVRISAEPLATTGATGEDVRQALLAAANWARHALRRAGLAGQVLDRARLLDALATSLNIDAKDSAAGPPLPGGRILGTGVAAAPGPRGRRTVESWRGWQVDEAAQTVYAVAGWPRASGLAAAWTALASPTADSTVAVTLSPAAPESSEEVEVRALVRYCARGPTSRAALRAHRQAGITLRSLPGDQAPAAYASAPTGGGGR
jgi:type VII secretion protein EccE